MATTVTIEQCQAMFTNKVHHQVYDNTRYNTSIVLPIRVCVAKHRVKASTLSDTSDSISVRAADVMALKSYSLAAVAVWYADTLTYTEFGIWNKASPSVQAWLQSPASRSIQIQSSLFMPLDSLLEGKSEVQHHNTSVITDTMNGNDNQVLDPTRKVSIWTGKHKQEHIVTMPDIEDLANYLPPCAFIMHHSAKYTHWMNTDRVLAASLYASLGYKDDEIYEKVARPGLEIDYPGVHEASGAWRNGTQSQLNCVRHKPSVPRYGCKSIISSADMTDHCPFTLGADDVFAKTSLQAYGLTETQIKEVFEGMEEKKQHPADVEQVNIPKLPEHVQCVRACRSSMRFVFQSPQLRGWMDMRSIPDCDHEKPVNFAEAIICLGST
jgi:hypothetical protein